MALGMYSHQHVSQWLSFVPMTLTLSEDCKFKGKNECLINLYASPITSNLCWLINECLRVLTEFFKR